MPPAASSHFTHPAVRPTTGTVGWVHVLFFGKLADHFGRHREVAIPPGGCPLAEIEARLARTVDGGEAALAEPGVRRAVSQQICPEDIWVVPGEEVAFFSAFSGG